jgi:hypothetical protein
MTLPPVYGTGGGGGGISYTTSEQDTGLTYTGGETIYEITVIRATALTAGATPTNIAHGITGMVKLISATATADRSNSDFILIPLASNSASFAIEMRLTATNIIITPGTGWTNSGTEILTNTRVTVRYTKA